MSAGCSDDAIHSFLETLDGDTGASRIPDERAAISCCCGNSGCAYLQQNQSALDGLERSVHNAASLGKVCLIAHLARRG